MVFDLNLPAATTVCGMSSRFFQVTVVPTFTFSSLGSKVKLSILTVVSSARARPEGRKRAAAMAREKVEPKLRRVSDVIAGFLLALQRGVDDRKALLARLEVDAGNAEQRTQLGILDLHRPGRGRRARRRLREGGRACGVEGHVALDLLHHLVDVAVEYGDRAKALEVVQRAA